LSGHHVLTYAALVAPFLVSFFIYRTRLGLRLRAVGENPHAVESVGISVTKIRFIAFALSGALAGMGGAYLSMGYLSAFLKNMTAGRGYIGLSANNMVGGSPIGSLFSSILFGTADVVANVLQMTQAPADLVFMLPYAVTILGLIAISILYRRREREFATKAAKARLRQK
jgi:simple sugar transport system permease protein